jgi:hypothetical protein
MQTSRAPKGLLARSEALQGSTWDAEHVHLSVCFVTFL